MAVYRNIEVAELIDRIALAKEYGPGIGNVFYVGSASGGLSTSDGLEKKFPLATLAQGVAKCSANHNDIVCLLALHAETGGTTTIDVNVAGVTIVGCGHGRSRPTFTASTSAVDLMTVSAANVRIHNVRFVGAASGCTALLNITSTDGQYTKCQFDHGAAPLRAVTMSAAHRTTFKDCNWLGTAAGPDWGVLMLSDSTDCVWDNLIFDYGVVGLDNGAIGTSGSGTAAGHLMKDIFGIGMDLALVDINNSVVATACEGILTRYAGAVRVTTLSIGVLVDAGGLMVCDGFLSDATAAAASWSASVAKGLSKFPAASPN